ncbi:MAG: hypothetical protein Q8O99_02100 [bacterium]|nr:hypothetical protein [bacterium]
MQPNQLVSDAYLAYQNTHHVHEEFLCSREIAKSSKNEIIEVFETFNPFLQAFKKTVGTPSGLAYKRYEEQLRQAEKNVHDAQQQKEAAKKELMKALTLQVANQDPLIIEAGLLIVALEDIGRQIREIVECIPGLQKQLKSDMKFEFFDLITTNTTAVGLVGMLGSYMKSGKSIKYLEAFARQNEDLHRKREIMHDKLKSFYELISQHEQFDEFKEIDLPEVKGGKLINAIE